MLRRKHLTASFLTVIVIIGVADSINPFDRSQASSSKSSGFRLPNRNTRGKNRPPADFHRSIPAEDANISTNATLADFERLTLVQRWPLGTCDHPFRNCVTTWLLEGLWPSDANGNPLTYCKGNKFDRELPKREKFKDWLHERLKYYLTNSETEKSRDDEDILNLWENEWNKHGTCYGPSQVAYFGKAVKLIEIYNVGPMLNDQMIKPTLRYPYPYLKIYDAIRDSAVMKNHGARIICDYTRNNEVVHEFIKEVHICFKRNRRNEFEVDDCPGMYEENLDGCNVGQTKYY